jgi:hypothetical protein
MKSTLYYLLPLLLIFSACKKDSIEHSKDFDVSYIAWLNFKASANNSYQYQVTTISLTGYSTNTTITIKAGKVTKRTYVAKTIKQPGNLVTIHKEWVENENELNTHDSAAPILTLDEIYAKAKTDLLLKRSDAKVYFEAENNGMISSCGYVQSNCADDCFNGINIAFIEKI